MVLLLSSVIPCLVLVFLCRNSPDKLFILGSRFQVVTLPTIIYKRIFSTNVIYSDQGSCIFCIADLAGYHKCTRSSTLIFE